MSTSCDRSLCIAAKEEAINKHGQYMQRSCTVPVAVAALQQKLSLLLLLRNSFTKIPSDCTYQLNCTYLGVSCLAGSLAAQLLSPHRLLLGRELELGCFSVSQFSSCILTLELPAPKHDIRGRLRCL